MRKIYKYLMVIVLACTSLVSNAQNDGVGFTLMPQIPYANYYNPGIRMTNNGLVGVAFSNINISMFNSSMKYSNLFGNDKTAIDAVKFVESLDDDNNINMNFSMDLVNVGFKVKDFYFSLDWRMRMTSTMNYSKDFIGFFVYGNGHYLGRDNPCDFSLGLDAALYSEFGVGVQYAVNEKLTVGIRPKLLNGIANVVVDNKDTKIYTDAESYVVSADVDLNIKVASMFKSDVRKIGDITNVFDSNKGGNMYDFGENIGFGVDLGASYTINEHIGVAAGIYDLGYIKWRDAKVKSNKKTDVELNGTLFEDYHDLTNFELDYKSMLNDGVDAVWGNDSLEVGADYKTYLKSRFMAQGYYELNPMVRFSAIGQLYFVNGSVKPALTLAYSGMFWNHLNVTVNGTLSKYTGSSIGAGLGFHAGPFNIYAVTDNLLCIFKVGSPALEMASSYRSANIRMGIVFAW